MARDRGRGALAARTPKLTGRYFSALARARLRPGTPDGRALARTIRALLDAEILPGALDVVVPIPPVARAYVRRVAGRNLWLWYDVVDEAVILVFVSRQPPAV